MSGHACGFTLLEFLIALAIVSVALGIGIPALDYLIRQQQIAATHNDLLATLLLTRSEAIKRKKPVIVHSAGSLWSEGWMLFVDENGNGKHDEEEPLLKVSGSTPKGIRVSGNTPVRQYVRYVPTGRTRLMGGAFQAGTITLCHEGGQHPVRRLIISATGRLRTERGKADSC